MIDVKQYGVDFLVGGILVSTVAALSSSGMAALGALVATIPIKDTLAVDMTRDDAATKKMMWSLLMADIAVTIGTGTMIVAKERLNFSKRESIAVSLLAWFVSSLMLIQPWR